MNPYTKQKDTFFTRLKHLFWLIDQKRTLERRTPNAFYFTDDLPLPDYEEPRFSLAHPHRTDPKYCEYRMYSSYLKVIGNIGEKRRNEHIVKEKKKLNKEIKQQILNLL